jgi:TetR/AcrR family tetracycline transcriptional repressor
MEHDALPAPPWLQRRPVRHVRRPVASPLSRDAIVAEALALVDQEGLEALTVRRLADRLGVTTMALYWHVRDKGQLLDLVGEAVLAEVDLPARTDRWEVDLRALLHAARDTMQRHPDAAVLGFGRARYGPSGLAMFEDLLGILVDAGFEEEEAGLAYMALYTLLRGNWSSESSARLDREQFGAYRDYLASLPPDRFPYAAAIGPRLFRTDPQAFFDYSLDTLIAGLQARGARG